MRKARASLMVVHVMLLLALMLPSASLHASGPGAPPARGGKPCGGDEQEPNDSFAAGGGCVLVVGDTLAGKLDPPYDRDWFEFGWQQPDVWYKIKVVPDPGVDAWLVVQTHDGVRIGFSDRGGLGANESVYFVAPNLPVVSSVDPCCMSYVVGVSTSAAGTGGYVLSITQTAPPPTPPPVPTDPPLPPPPPPAPTNPPPAPTSPAPAPTASAAPQPGGGGAPRATATVVGRLGWRLVGAAPGAGAVVTRLHVQVYYDVNGSRGAEPGEGVAGLSVRAVAHGEFVGWSITDADGAADLVIVGPIERVVVPFLNVQREVQAGATTDIVFRLEAVRLPTFLPVKES